MNSKATKTIMNKLLLLGLGTFWAGCGPDFDPASLITNTRVVGARIEVEGAPERATPKPGETANLKWLITSETTPSLASPLHWAFAVCAPDAASLGCDGAPLARFEGTDGIPAIALAVPALDALGAARSLNVYGQICSGVDSLPTFDPQHGIPGCSSGGGTTVSTNVPLQLEDDANHNPIADRTFTFDGQPWPTAASSDDPCVAGMRIAVGTKDHVIGNRTEGSDREPYTAMVGDPPVATAVRESLQISQFTTAGKLKSQFSFVESGDVDAATTVDATWEAPKADEVPAAGMAVTFTFVVRDNRGGADWTTRKVCVSR